MKKKINIPKLELGDMIDLKVETMYGYSMVTFNVIYIINPTCFVLFAQDKIVVANIDHKGVVILSESIDILFPREMRHADIVEIHTQLGVKKL